MNQYIKPQSVRYTLYANDSVCDQKGISDFQFFFSTAVLRLTLALSVIDTIKHLKLDIALMTDLTFLRSLRL